RTDLQALYAGYYVAELLAEWTEDYDPHPVLFDEALATLEDLGKKKRTGADSANLMRLTRFELVMLKELGYSPVLDRCAACGRRVNGNKLVFDFAAGGVICAACQPGHRERRPTSAQAWEALQANHQSAEAWKKTWPSNVRAEVRRLIGDYITYLRGKPARLS